MVTREKRSARKAELFGDLITQMELRQQRARSGGHVKKAAAGATASAHGSMPMQEAPGPTFGFQPNPQTRLSIALSGVSSDEGGLGNLHNTHGASPHSDAHQQQHQQLMSYSKREAGLSPAQRLGRKPGPAHCSNSEDEMLITPSLDFDSELDELEVEIRMQAEALPMPAQDRLLRNVRELLITSRAEANVMTAFSA